MTAVLFTTDTELSFMLHQRGASPLENLSIAIMGEVSDGAWGIGYQMKRLSAHKLKGVFFVEALSSYLFGNDILKRTVAPILAAGHEVQLHLHTEWLRWIDQDIVGSRRNTNIAGFAYDDQRRLLEAAIDAMEQAGAPRPTAFRAGNYGANNDTLRALASFGIQYDSSYNRPFLDHSCAICADARIEGPTHVDGVTEIPVTCFEDFPGHRRGLQLCAVSSAEFKAIVRQAIAQRRPSIVAVNHSFELLGVKRTRANRMLLKRFDEYCAFLEAQRSEIRSAGFYDLDGAVTEGAPALAPLTSNPMRTAMRMVEQSVGAYLYDRA